MVTAIDTHEEARLLATLKRAGDMVDEGLAPTAAFTKLARELQLTPGRIDTLCFAYNTGRQTQQRTANSGALGKFASFDLADPAAVRQAIYGTQTKTASVDSDYARGPYWLERQPRTLVKTAAAPVPIPGPSEPMSALRRQWSARDVQKQAADEFRRQGVAATDKLRTKLATLVDYFHQPLAMRLSFADAERGARTYFGKAGESLFACVHAQLHSGEKRAGDALTPNSAPINQHTEPFTTVRDCLALTKEIHNLRAKTAEAQQQLQGVKKEAAAYCDGDVSLLDGSTREKEAGLLGPAVGAGLATFLNRGIGQVPKTKDDLVDDAQLDLEDPAHQNELRKIKAHTMLTSMLTDPDDPIAGHDPDKVLREYNEVASLTPRLADQPAVLRSVLQRRLQGGIQPFEAKELTDIEKALAQTRAINTSRGSDDGSLLG